MEILKSNNVTSTVALLGVRGYFKKTMGDASKNDRGIYDDAIFLISDRVYAAFNANTDPSIFKKHIAVLKTGVWWYKKGKHKMFTPQAYDAFIQAKVVTVLRDGEGEDTGFFGINIHRGGLNTTSSEGCQTIFPAQWLGFQHLAYSEMTRLMVPTIPYCLIENV